MNGIVILDGKVIADEDYDIVRDHVHTPYCGKPEGTHTAMVYGTAESNLETVREWFEHLLNVQVERVWKECDLPSPETIKPSQSIIPVRDLRNGYLVCFREK